MEWNDEYEKLIWSACKKYAPLVKTLLSPVMDMDDILQELRVRVWYALTYRYNGKARISTFVYTVVHNRLIQMIEHSAQQRRSPRVLGKPTRVCAIDESWVADMVDPREPVESQVVDKLTIEWIKCRAAALCNDPSVSELVDWMLGVCDTSIPHGSMRKRMRSSVRQALLECNETL